MTVYFHLLLAKKRHLIIHGRKYLLQPPPNKKSMAYSVVFTPKDEELKTKKVEGFVKDILAHLKETAGVTLRG